MSAINVLSTYSLAAISNGVNASSGSPAYIWSVAIPSGAKGKSGVLEVFFNLYCASGFFANQTFDYGLYIDGTSIALGDSTTTRYTQSAATTYAMSSGGILRGTNGVLGYTPMSVPLSIPAGASLLQIGITNSSVAMATATSVTPHVTSNVSTATGTLNTSDYIPKNTFTTSGSNAYVVPTTVQGGAVQGVFIYCWGAGAGHSYIGAGSGGFASAYYPCAGGTTLVSVVGAIGTGTISSGGGGQQSGYLGAGGFSGVFSSVNLTQANALVIAGGAGSGTLTNAGGGGGAGSADSNASGVGYAGGPGWYWTTSVVSGVTGGTLSAGGSSGGQALLGASPASVSLGGGGYYGGGGGNNGGMGGGGGGGSSFVSNSCTGATFSPGTYCTGSGVTSIPPGGVSNQYYVANSYNYGYGGSGGSNAAPNYQGLVVIVPAIGSTATQIGVSATLYSL